jgi:hypothetical protein
VNARFAPRKRLRLYYRCKTGDRKRLKSIMVNGG